MSKVLPFQVFEALKLSKSLTLVKRGVCVDFHQAGGLQNEQSLPFQEKSSKDCLWVSCKFLQNPRSFKRFSILEENCGADIIMEHLNVSFLLTDASKPVVG